MPNWTENKVTVTGSKEVIAEFIEFVKDEHNAFSFESIMPMPPALCIEAGGRTWRGLELINDPERWADLDSETKALTRRAEINIKAYGAQDWYHWCIERWGTKWDCSDVIVVDKSDTHVVYQFSTAWNGPAGIAVALRDAFPELDITWQCLNEECSSIEVDGTDEDDDDHWVYVCLDENPHTYEI